MNENKNPPCCFLAPIVLWVGFMATSGWAQTGPLMMIKPFEQERHAELSGSTAAYQNGSTNRTGDNNFGLTIYDAQGRAALLPDPQRLKFGFDLTQYDIDTNETGLPKTLSDQSYAVGFRVAKFASWEIGGVLGTGFAGDNPYSDGNAWYGIASVIASYEFNEDSNLQLLLDYNGNRGLFPDLPLPGVTYNRKVSDVFRYIIGVPSSSLIWLPAEGLTATISGVMPFFINADIDYKFTEGWHLFGNYGHRVDGFHLDGDDNNRRVFFTQEYAEVGGRWEAEAFVELILAVGYAFDREVKRGFDLRELEKLRDISEEWYIRAAVQLRF